MTKASEILGIIESNKEGFKNQYKLNQSWFNKYEDKHPEIEWQEIETDVVAGYVKGKHIITYYKRPGIVYTDYSSDQIKA